MDEASYRDADESRKGQKDVSISWSNLLFVNITDSKKKQKCLKVHNYQTNWAIGSRLLTFKKLYRREPNSYSFSYYQRDKTRILFLQLRFNQAHFKGPGDFMR